MKVKLSIIGFLAVFGLITLLLGFRTIDAGEVGVVTKFGKVTGRTLAPGASFVTPWVDGVTVYNTKKVIYETATAEGQKGSQANYKDFPVDTNTKDGQQVNIFYTVRFAVDPTKTTFVAQNIGSESALVDKIVKTESRIWARNIPREFEAQELYSGTGVIEVQNGIEAKLRPTFETNGLILDSVGIREIKFSEEYVNAIENKQIQFVKIETEKNIAEQEKYKKEAKITAAEASAKEQELQKITISDQLLKKMWIERWNGTLPTYVMGSEATNLIQLP
jgi:regulator of protease activity HflC (stomatin/prohibitin superfamily)